MSTRIISSNELSHENLGERFAEALNQYDTKRRVEVLIDDFLGGGTGNIKDLKVLDVGCGLGFFSEAAANCGACVTAIDLGPNLVRKTKDRVPSARTLVADALDLAATLGCERFDAVISSECIEHTPDPKHAVVEMLKFLKPGGLLSLSTPNLVWQPIVHLASKLRLRPFDGLENFLSMKELRLAVEQGGADVLRHTGLHLFPFQLGLHGLSRMFDKKLQFMAPLMINQCILARKR